MKQSAFPKSRQNDIVVQRLEDEVLIYDLSSHKAFCLNDTSGLVWQMCDGNRSVGDIAGEIGRTMKTSVSEELVKLAIDGLKKDNLLENGAEIETNLSGLSRREVIKKIALTSAVALPIISSLVAPKAASAASVLTCTASACNCSQAGIVTSCSDPASCQVGCTCRIPTAANCTPDGNGGFDCAGTCAA